MTTSLEKTALEKIQDHKEKIKSLQEDAIAELIKAKNEKLLELENIDKQLVELGYTDISITKEKRTRKTFPKTSDAELKIKLDKFLEMGKSSNNVGIIEHLEISRPRFEKFNKDFPTYLKTNGETGKKKLYLLNK